MKMWSLFVWAIIALPWIDSFHHSSIRYSRHYHQLYASESFSTNVKVVDLTLLDFPSIIVMCNRQFLNENSTWGEKIELNQRMAQIFLPKFVQKKQKGHDVIGLKRVEDDKLVGFVDVSLQASDGSLDVLFPSTLDYRIRRYSRETLQPYLCNLLVSPEFRKQGLARKLILECEKRGKEMFDNNIKTYLSPPRSSYLHLHVELLEFPALNLYINSGFVERSRVKADGVTVLFMRKPLLASSAVGALVDA